MRRFRIRIAYPPRKAGRSDDRNKARKVWATCNRTAHTNAFRMDGASILAKRVDMCRIIADMTVKAA